MEEKVNEKIAIMVGERLLSRKHHIHSEFDRSSTVNVLRNLADLLDEEHRAITFKEKKFRKRK